MSKLKCIAHLASVAFVLSFASVMPAYADTVYNTIGGMENGGDPLSGAGPVLADRFVSSSSGPLSSVTLNLSLAGSPAGQGFTIDLFSDAGASGPGAVVLQIANVLDSSLSNAFTLETYAPSMDYLLTAGQSYYIGVMDNGSNATLGNTLDPAVLGRADVLAGTSYYNNGGVQANAGGPYELSVATTTTPEPASLALVVSGGMAALGLLRRKISA